LKDTFVYGLPGTASFERNLKTLPFRWAFCLWQVFTAVLPQWSRHFQLCTRFSLQPHAFGWCFVFPNLL